MKCDELKEIMLVNQVSGERTPSGTYKKAEVDAAIAELKARIHELESMPHTDNSAVIDALETENAELKTKLAEEREFGLNRAKSADHEIGKLCAELCELNAEKRKLKRTLWLARAKAANEAHFMWCQLIYDRKYGIVKFNVNKEWGKNIKQGQTLHTPTGWADVWDDVERKCLKKAEEYK